MGVEEGSLKGAVEVYAPVKGINNYSWIQNIEEIYTLGNESIFLCNFSLNNVVLFANKSIEKYMPLEDGRFFENKGEIVIGKSLLKDLKYAGYNIDIGKEITLKIEKWANNKTMEYTIKEKIVGILPSALSHFGGKIIMPYSLLNVSDLFPVEYVITPKKGISIAAVYDYLQANTRSTIAPNNPVDVSMFRFYIWVLGFFSFTAGFIFIMLLYEHEGDYFFKEYAIMQISGGNKGRFLRKYLIKDFLFLIICYAAAYVVLFITAPYLYRFLNNTFNNLVFTYNVTYETFLIPIISIFVLFAYQLIVLKYKIYRFSLIQFIREGWKL